MRYITITLTEDQARCLVNGLEFLNERTQTIIDTPEAFNKVSVSDAKRRFAFRRRLQGKLQAELVKL